MARFKHEFNLSSELSVLDVGGSGYNWTLISLKPKLTILNVEIPINPVQPKSVNWLIADGRHLPFKDAAFDIVYSNSVIEHLSTFSNQTLFAEECRRVGIYYYIQTPNKWFPIEPHYLMAFIHWLPISIQRRLIRNFTIRGWVNRPSQIECERMINELRLLTKREFQQIFPDADIWQERFLGLSKSIIAVRCN
jgi:ubiquinone/menaquinone biosynthesis C-methylase UbiE